MPSRNIVKQYVEGGYYHVYNRGVERRLLFIDSQDYFVFLKYLKSYLTDEPVFGSGRSRPNLSDRVQVLAFCLMPNHYHLLLHQNSISGVTELIRRVMTGYSLYFNQRYGRVGTLFQAHFKAASITTDEYLMHVSRYIHLNPLGIGAGPESYRFSSLQYYKSQAPGWLDVAPVLNLFEGPDEYLQFVRDLSNDSEAVLGDMALDALQVRPVERSDLSESFALAK
ncbi:MAG TPA: transposase [Candidatus Saccharimonadales bacterium]|nr:transposase [Candidatus Saccharimonadales bacterium]